MSLATCFAGCVSKLAECFLEEWGDSADFSTRGGPPVTIVGTGSERTVEITPERGIDRQLITMKFTAPKQTGFPPDGTKEGGNIAMDDTLTLNNCIYYVTKVEQDAARITYVLYLENEEARRLKG